MSKWPLYMSSKEDREQCDQICLNVATLAKF